MANESTSDSASLGPSIPTLVYNKLIVETREYMLAAALATSVDNSASPGLGQLFSRLSNSFSPGDPLANIANGSGEAAAVTDTQLTQDSVTITPSAKAASVLLSKVAQRAAAVDWPQEIISLLARAAADRLDYDGLSVFTSFSNVTGTSGVRLTLGTHRAATTALRLTAKNYAGRAVAVYHPTCFGHVQDELLSGSGAALSAVLRDGNIASIFGDDNVSQGMMDSYGGDLLGRPCLLSSNVPAATGDFANAMIIPQNPSAPDDPMTAFGMVKKWDLEINQYDLRLISQLATRFVADMAYAYGVLNNNLGRKILASGS